MKGKLLILLSIFVLFLSPTLASQKNVESSVEEVLIGRKLGDGKSLELQTSGKLKTGKVQNSNLCILH